MLVSNSQIVTLQQWSSERFLDAYESNGGNDYGVMTRSPQNNDSQKWVITPVAIVCRLRERSSNRFLEVSESAAGALRAVIAEEQTNNNQLWVFQLQTNTFNTYTIQHAPNGLFLDGSGAPSGVPSWGVLTLPEKEGDSRDRQLWYVNRVYDGNELLKPYTIQQKSNGRFLDAYQSALNGWAVVTRPDQSDQAGQFLTQQWEMREQRTVYTAQQLSSGRYLDAHESAANYYKAVTRKKQQNNSQLWIFHPGYEGNIFYYRIQRFINGQFLDAYQTPDSDRAWEAVTRPDQSGQVDQFLTQRWRVNS